MALSRRQQILFTQRVDLYEPILNRNPTTGRPEEREYPPRYTDVPCFRVARDDVSDPAVVFRLPGDNMWTHDEWHFAEDQEIAENWRIHDKSQNADGVNTETFGIFYLVSGQPKRTPKQGRRDAGNTVVQATREIRQPRELVTS